MTVPSPTCAGAQADLFAPPHVPGLAQATAFIRATEEAALITQIDAAAPTPFRFQGWLGKRLTRAFGWSYDFETGRFAPTDPSPSPSDPVRPGGRHRLP